MKLYYTKGACSFAVRIVINELGLVCEYEAVDLHSKKTADGNDFLKINPKGAVPSFQADNGEILTENAVILQYLADKNNAHELLPPISDFKRYHILEWLNFVATELHKSIGAFFNPKLTQEMKDAVTLPYINAKLSIVDKHLQNNQYLLGDSFTLPDAYMTVMLMWAKHFKIDMSAWPNLSRYFGEMMGRPSVQKSLKEEGFA